MLLKTAQHKSGLDCEAGSPISAQLGRDVGGRGEERVKIHRELFCREDYENILITCVLEGHR